jgi:acetyltransferase
VRLVLATQQNGPHRAEVSKLLVRPDARRSGCATALMGRLESWARENGRTRLVLDTETGSDAEQLYQRLGWQPVGVVPDFALGARGGLADATIYTKGLTD